MKREAPAAQAVWAEFEKGIAFKNQINLYDTVKRNEDFFIGKQWEGVQSNGLPTPVFNFIKRIILFLVASTATDNIKMSASPLSSTGLYGAGEVERLCAVVNAQFEALFEQNKVGKLTRDFMRNAAVDGDGCLYSWFDPEVETGQEARGAIRTELLENTRVIFGNPNARDPQGQPYILVSRRELVEEVRRQAKEMGGEPDGVRPDADEANDRFDALTDGKVTTLTRLWRGEEGTIWCQKSVKDGIVRRAWDTGQKRYPIVWMSWDYVPGCCHGQAAVTGLIPNQVFVNKMFAMTMISLMTTAYPKVVYDKTRVAKWSAAVGQAIGVNGGDVGTVAKTIDPPAISPQVGQFISLAIDLTKEFMGATDAALGDTRPDNTSAIIALQKASSVPMELTKQNLFQAIEDLGNVWLDLMRVYYGQRYVEMEGFGGDDGFPSSVTGGAGATFPRGEGKGRPAGVPSPQGEGLGMAAAGEGLTGGPALFDFSVLDSVPLSLKLDVGGSAYWSEIAQMNTLDNLLTQGKISVIDYLERVPSGYISNQQELIETLKDRQAAMTGMGPGIGGGNVADPGLPDQVSGGSGYGQLQRKLNTVGAEGLKLMKS